MKVISFALYYCKLLLGVLFGVHKTVYPLKLSWRWSHWQDKYKKNRVRLF